MKKLLIFVPVGTNFEAHLSSFPKNYEKIATSPRTICYKYLGEYHPKDKVSQILSLYKFDQYTIRIEKNHYAFRIYHE